MFESSWPQSMILPNPAPRIAFIANGAIDDLVLIANRLKDYPYRIAVDGGLRFCQLMNIRPDLIVGDMDSVSDSLLSHYADIPLRRFNCDKDQTDLELAMQIMDTPQVKEMVVFGGLNKRLDHTLANLHLLHRYPGKASLESEVERVFAIQGSVTIPSRPSQLISLIPLDGPIQGVSSKGLRWELHNATLNSFYLSVSNQAMADCVSINVASGKLICVMQI